MVVSLEMVLPGMAGYWLDQRLGTVVLFMLVGFGLGCTAAVAQLIQIARANRGSQVERLTSAAVGSCRSKFGMSLIRCTV